MQNTVILVTRNGVGSTDEKFQQVMFGNSVELISENERLPGALCCHTDGVKLVCECSYVIPELPQLEGNGVHPIICSTGVNYFEMTTKVKVRIVGGMADILRAQIKAEKVISI